MLKIKQYLCKHDYQLIGRDKVITADLYRCDKCKVYLHHHWILPMAGVKYRLIDMNDYYTNKEVVL